jgi:ribosomal protein S18 acetylase RimI-like enzyme
MDQIIIRPAAKSDLPALGRLGALLLRTHYEFDQQRFMAPGSSPDQGYAWFLGTQLSRRDVAVFVAEDGGNIVGYVYAGIEPQSWKELRDRAGFIHDVVVDESKRRRGIAKSLLSAALEWLQKQGVPRVVLWTAEKNNTAQRLFTKLGFRRTMIEMTRELT